MIRLILVLFVFGGLALALVSVMVALRIAAPNLDTRAGDTMPKTFSTIAYIVLIALMFGVASGLLGAT